MKYGLKALNKEYADIESKHILKTDLLITVQQEMHNSPLDTSLQLKEKEASKEYWKACRDLESFYKQKCKANWLREGDQNTKFFHATLKARRN